MIRRLPIASTTATAPGSIDRGGVDLLHHGGPLDAIARPQPVAGIDGGGLPASVGVDLALADPRRSVAGARQRRQREAAPPADHGGDQIDQHGADLRQAHPEAGEIGLLEQGLQLLAADRGRGDRNADQVRLAAELHVGAVQHHRLDDLVALGRVDRLALGALRLQRRLDAAHVERGERRVDGVDEVLAQVGDQAAERVGEPRPRRHEHLGDAKLARDRHGMQRPGPAEGEQHEVARVVAARQRHQPDGAGHVGIGEPEDGGSGILDGEAERPGQPVADGGAHGLHVDGALDGGEARRIEPAEHQVGVGDGGLAAAAAVADRPRRRAGRLGAHLQHAGRVERRDGAAAGADRAHVHHRHVDRQAVGDGQLRRHLRHAAVDQRHIGGGAAHVVGDGVAEARLGERGRRGDHARGRPRHHRLGRVAGDQARGDRAAVAVHDQEVAREAALLQLALQPAHVAVEDRLHRRIHGGRRAALVLAVLGQQLVAERHVVVGPERAHDLARAQLVRRVGVGSAGSG